MKKFLNIFYFLLFVFFSPLTLSSREASDEKWDRIGNETAKNLSFYLSIDTTNPPGNENKSCLFLKGILLRHGIPSQIIINPRGGYNLISVIKGKTKKPILLLNNMDVPSGNDANWEVPPFSGKIKKGLVFGRGALDMKGMALMQLYAFIEIKKMGIELDRDLIFLALPDGETFGEEGAKWFVENKILEDNPEYVLGEGFFGAQDVIGNESSSYLVAIGENRYVDASISIPLNLPKSMSGYGTNLQQVQDILIKVNEHTSQVRLFDSDLEFFKSISSNDNFLKRFLLSRASNPIIWNFIKNFILKDKIVSNLLTSSVYPLEVILNEGSSPILQLRATYSLKPKIEVKQFFNELKEKIGKKGTKISILKDIPPYVSPTETDFYRSFVESVKEINEEAVVAPYIIPYLTDLRFFRKAGITSYGITPVVLSREVLESRRNVNERIPIDQLGLGARIIYQTILNVNKR